MTVENRFPVRAAEGVPYWDLTMLGSPVRTLVRAAVEQAGGSLLEDGPLPAHTRGMLLCVPAPAVSAESLRRLYEGDGLCLLRAGRTVLAACGEGARLCALDPDAPPEDASFYEAAPGEGVAVCSAESAYAAQEALRRRVNMGLLAAGVFLADPNTAHISPLAELAPGCTVLPNCQIYGRSVLAAGCTVGPNALLRDARVGEGASINASQLLESEVGPHTTVGPFAYIRPGCRIGAHVRVGDFVELKNSTVGDGTKLSHLTYIGDSDLGQNINVGCGVVTVNYDGKRKWRTRVDDGAFVGCNVNLVSPVHVGEGAYLAAGGTVTEDVPPESLHIARARASVKPGWVEERRRKGLL